MNGGGIRTKNEISSYKQGFGSSPELLTGDSDEVVFSLALSAVPFASVSQ